MSHYGLISLVQGFDLTSATGQASDKLSSWLPQLQRQTEANQLSLTHMALSYSYTAQMQCYTEGLQHLSKQTCPAHMSAVSNQKRTQSSCTINSFTRHSSLPTKLGHFTAHKCSARPVCGVLCAVVYIKSLWAKRELLEMCISARELIHRLASSNVSAICSTKYIYINK